MTRSIKPFVGLILLASGMLTGCGHDAWEEEFSDPAVPIRASVNDHLVLRLSSNPSTGYSWSLGAALDEAIVRLEGSRYVDGESTLPGSGGTEYWTFEAVGKGCTTIVMRYAQPWEDSGATTGEYRICVE